MESPFCDGRVGHMGYRPNVLVPPERCLYLLLGRCTIQANGYHSINLIEDIILLF